MTWIHHPQSFVGVATEYDNYSCKSKRPRWNLRISPDPRHAREDNKSNQRVFNFFGEGPMKVSKLSNATFESREGYERAILYNDDEFGSATKLQLMRLAAGKTIRPHHHVQRTECFRIVSGEGQIKVNGQVVATSPDDIVLCEPGDVHEFINLSATEPLTFLVIRTNDPGNEDMIWEK